MSQNEETISLKDLFIYILKKWRVLIIAMFIGAVLLGIYKGKFSPQAIPLSTAEQQEIQDLIDKNNDSISDYTLTIKENKNKLVENTDAIKSYQAELEVQKELVADLEAIVAKYNKAGTQASDNLVSSTIQLATEKKKVSVYETQIAELQHENSEIPKTNSSLQETIYKLKKDNRELTESLSSQQFVKAGMSSIIKYAVLGAFLGAFLICGIAFLKYILYKKLRNEDELRVKYNIRVIGNLHVIPEEKNKNKIDKLINKWSGYNVVVDEHQQYKLIYATIQLMSSSKDKKVILTGTVDPVLINQIMDKLNTVLPQNDCTLCTIPNPVYDGDALLNIKESSVILVEAKYVSDMREIDKLIDILYAGKSEVLGAVIL